MVKTYKANFPIDELKIISTVVHLIHAVVPALYDVERDTIELDAGTAGHCTKYHKTIDADPFYFYYFY